MNALLAPLASAIACPPRLVRHTLQARASVVPAGIHRLTGYGRKTGLGGQKP
jgi:hypothetical protein